MKLRIFQVKVEGKTLIIVFGLEWSEAQAGQSYNPKKW